MMMFKRIAGIVGSVENQKNPRRITCPSEIMSIGESGGIVYSSRVISSKPAASNSSSLNSSEP